MEKNNYNWYSSHCSKILQFLKVCMSEEGQAGFCILWYNIVQDISV